MIDNFAPIHGVDDELWDRLGPLMQATVPRPPTAAQLTLQDTWLFGGTIRDADLMVMEAVQIVEQRTHASLLDAEGTYAQLYAPQFAAPVAEVKGGWRSSIVRLSSKSLLSCVRKRGNHTLC